MPARCPESDLPSSFTKTDPPPFRIFECRSFSSDIQIRIKALYALNACTSHLLHPLFPVSKHCLPRLRELVVSSSESHGDNIEQLFTQLVGLDTITPVKHTDPMRHTTP